MGPELLERIFDPFFTTKDEGKGSDSASRSSTASSRRTAATSRSRASRAARLSSASRSRERSGARTLRVSVIAVVAIGTPDDEVLASVEPAVAGAFGREVRRLEPLRSRPGRWMPRAASGTRRRC